MELNYILLIFITHFIADFIFQSEEMAKGKSVDNLQLLKHTLMYSFITFICFFIMGLFEWVVNISHTLKPLNILLFTIITFIFHTITDYMTSRVVKQKFDNEEYGSDIPNLGAFTIIGFDQVLHYVQLFLTFSLAFL